MTRIKFFPLASFLIGSILLSSFSGNAAESPLKFHFSNLVGYDNNTLLDSSRQGDGFTQQSAGVNYRKSLNDKSQFRLSYDALNVSYFKATDVNIFLNEAGAGLDYLIAPQTLLETDYTFQYLDFTHNNDVSSLYNGGRIGIKQKLSEFLMFRLGFTAGSRDFVEGKLTQANGIRSLTDERSDARNAFDSELSYKWSKSVLLRAGYGYYWNDSNDQFHDYYDYSASKYYAGMSMQWDARFSSIVKLSYERRNYDSRPLLLTAQEFENDDTYTATTGHFYKVNESLSLGLLYSYRQKNSNEPSQKYSGSVSTLGVYYSF